MSNVKLGTRFAEARQLDRDEHREKEVKKQGNLRAGNSGILSPEGQIAGGCHRVSHLRQLGLEIDPPGEHALLMFELGYANEDRIYSDLQRTLLPNEVIRREEEIPIEWTTSNGTKVSGRPDLVIGEQRLDQTFYPKLMVEIKSVHSVWVARDVLFSGKPKLENVIQTAHYMWKLGNIDGKLIYRQYSQQSMPKFGFSGPKQGEKFSEFIEYNDKGGAKHVKQFQVIYDVKIDSTGRVSYRHEEDAAFTPTLVNVNDIERYFEFISTMAEKRTLGPELLLIDLQGEEKGYDHTSYCVACQLARQVNGNYDQWLDLCKSTEQVSQQLLKMEKAK